MRNKIYGYLISGHKNNQIFDLNNKETNRDDCCYPYWLLKKNLETYNIILQTPDLPIPKNGIAEFCIYNDYRPNEYTPSSTEKKYIIALETPEIHPANAIEALPRNANMIFSWRKNLTNLTSTHLFFPNKIKLTPQPKYSSRQFFACMIAGNKSLKIKTKENLYIERKKTIKWFERNAKDSFHLYGAGWNNPAMPMGKIGRYIARKIGCIAKIVKHPPFPSYKGKVESKIKTLRNFKYSICYENIYGYNGYITEKIFDCFFAGCIPIYWGAPDIDQYIPANCYIDRRQFSSHEELLHYLQGISEQDFIGYQERIHNFLQSDAAKPFSAEYFANTITKQILQDLGIPA
ncbi:glycosyltransferase family 10 domain-containing protein [Vogesella indigofera]|uniref:glycosyltransferase family 10 domain-containing protein n=1 Tax=Vogesella indigofera TaxID=45465 RepID=UPI00234D98BE|nr:glycosyltransferase family 10 [Vogesella indigofera]MDC7704764.1 glycosyltransferase family 10 [Vogesella indigofera]